MKKALLTLSAGLFVAATLAPAFALAQAPAAAPAAPAAAPAAPARPAKLKVGDMAPDFEAAMLGGGTFKLKEFLESKKKAVVLPVVQSACVSCRAELEFLKTQTGKANYEIIMINVDAMGGRPQWETNMKTYMEESGLAMGVIMDPKMALARNFGIRVTPGMVIIDKDGKIADIRLGYDGEDAAEVTKKLENLR